ncbi:NB-ARC domain-containing protein [Armatimonas sp.]|uniref:AfsR/SARP family transcriptional regulator n=1 Tax=Armatimonas sp. TaxID=1872638 RepID=UPI0037530DF2
MASLPASQTLQVSLLGTLSLRVNGEDRTAKLQAPTRAMLVILVLESPAAISSLRLSALIWPEHPDDADGEARRDNNFRRHWMLLRRALGPEAQKALIKTRSEVRLDSTYLYADITAFRDTAQRGLQGELAILERAAALAEGGELLLGWEAPWLEGHRATLRKEAHAVWLALLDQWERASRLHDALALLERRRQKQPEDERYLRRRWLLLLQLGNHTAVLKEVRKYLDSGGREPETKALAERLSREANPPSEILEPLPRIPLPAPRTRLLGREGTLALLAALLPGTRLVTLYGPGGIGKTRLALEAAQQNMSRFREGVAFVDLTRLVPGARGYALQAELGRVLGQPSTTETSLQEALQHRDLLLVLDNAEHVRETVRQVLGELLAHCPQLHVLVTSREPLRLAGERLVPVGALTHEEAMTLFWERAPLAELPQSPEEKEAVVSICTRLEGLPLGIELAAASLERFTGLVPLAVELARSFHALAATALDATLPERAQTLTATIHWSEALRSEPERTLFRALAIFAGGASRTALAAIVGWSEPHTQQIADALVAASLLQADEQERWRLAEPLREYAWERLQEAQALEPLQQAQAYWYLHFTEESPPLALLETERANLERVQAFLLDTQQTELAHRLGAALWRFWYQCGSLVSGLAYLQRALDLPDHSNTAARRETLLGAANLAYALRESEPTQRFAQEALQHSEAANDGVREARALGSLGLSSLSAQQFPRAKAYFQQAYERFAALGDQRGVRLMHDNLALTATEAGDLDEALRLCQQSLPELRGDGQNTALVVGLNNAAHLHLRRHEDIAAGGYLRESLELALSLAYWRGLLQTLMVIVTWQERQQDFECCAKLLGLIAALRQKHSQPIPLDAKPGYIALEQRLESTLGSEHYANLVTEGTALPLTQLISLAFPNNCPTLSA